MIRHRATIVLLALAATLLAVAVMFGSFVGHEDARRGKPPGPHADADPGSHGDATIAVSSRRDTLEPKRAEDPPGRAALQADGLPVDRRIAMLLSAADAGDAWAACAADAEISRCRKLRARDRSWAGLRLDRVARSGLDDAQLREASLRLSDQLGQVEQLREACARLPLESEQAVMRLRLQAARAGDVESMRLFAEAEGVVEDLIANPDVYHLYRQNAWAIFLAAFQAGDPHAARLWLDVASIDSTLPLAGVTPPDWRDAAVASELATRVDANVYHGLDPGDPDHERASAVAEALYQRYFAMPSRRANPRTASDETVPALSTLTDIEQLTHFDILERDESRCELLR